MTTGEEKTADKARTKEGGLRGEISAGRLFKPFRLEQVGHSLQKKSTPGIR